MPMGNQALLGVFTGLLVRMHHTTVRFRNKYLNDNGVLVHYRWEEDLNAHQFMYYNPEGKKSF